MELTNRQKKIIGKVLVKARAIVDRVSPLVYGEFAIREFRRDLYTHATDPNGNRITVINPNIDCHLTSAECTIIGRVRRIEPYVMLGFQGMVGRIAEKSIFMGTNMDGDDLVQEGLQMLMLSMMGYNGSCDMSTYFWNVVMRYFQDFAKGERRRPTFCQCEDMDFPETGDDSEDMESLYDMDLFRYAIQCVKLTPLEETVIKIITEGKTCSEAARQVINPNTGKPFTRVSAQNALNSARSKIQAVYNTLLVRQRSRQRVA